MTHDTPQSAHARLKSRFHTGKTLPLPHRLQALQALRNYLIAHQQEFIAVHEKDLHKPHIETLTYDLYPLMSDLAYLISNLRRLSRPTKSARDFGAQVHVEPHPKGAVLVFGPFNFPLQVLLRPLAAAIAAGNVVCLKPSEIASAAEQFVIQLVEILDLDTVAVVTGGPEVAQQLLRLKWDHILFTGSNTIGKIVLRAAAETLTPVTLELGGKCPAVVTASAHLRTAAASIVRGRFLNCGQVCLATDYCLVEDAIYDEFLRIVRETVVEFYTESPKTSDCYGRIISSRHWDRVTAMLKSSKGRILIGGEHDDNDQHYLAPTVVEVFSDDDALMAEEIFGPILPILRIPSVESAVNYINSKDIPLALYIFSNDHQVVKKIIQETRSGSVGINETVLQVAPKGSHLGGVGESGMGCYGFSSGFYTFSHMRPVMYSTPFWAKCLSVLKPKFFGRNSKGQERKFLPIVLHIMGKFPFQRKITAVRNKRELLTGLKSASVIAVVVGIGLIVVKNFLCNV